MIGQCRIRMHGARTHASNQSWACRPCIMSLTLIRLAKRWMRMITNSSAMLGRSIVTDQTLQSPQNFRLIRESAKEMVTVMIAEKKIWVDDVGIPLLSGEVHYWRFDPAN